MDDPALIADLIRSIEKAWREGRFEEIGRHVHEGVVVAPPGFRTRIAGRGAHVESYREFGSNARVHSYELASPTVDLTGDTAVATSRYDMAWERDGQCHEETGHDVLVLTRQAGRWQIVWRTLIPLSDKG